MLTPDLIAQSEKRLDFDPKRLSEQIKHQRPIDNEPPDRQKIRLAVARAQGIDAVERVIAGSDLISINYLDKGIIAAKAVGRIHKLDTSGNLLEYATGFLISPRLLLTNHHVFRQSDDAATSQIEFNYQRDKDGIPLATETYAFLPEDFFFTSSLLDFTIVAVAQQGRQRGKPLAHFGWLVLDPQVGKVSPGESLTIIQHPSGQDKQIALRENQLLTIQENVLWYRTDTTPGSSGAPVFNDSWQVVALHRAGVPEKDAAGNWLTITGQPWKGATNAIDETQIKWIANEGVRASRIIATVQAKHPQHPLIQDIFGKAAPKPKQSSTEANRMSIIPNPILSKTNSASGGNSSHPPKPQLDHQPSGSTNVLTTQVVATDGTVQFTVPLTVTIQLGTGTTPLQASSSVPITPPASAPEEAISIDPNYRNRKGYDANFLGTSWSVPLPELAPELQTQCAINQQAKDGEDPFVLPYHHFSIVMHKERKLALYTAVNIDGKISYRVPRSSDKWIRDPRIGQDEQTDNTLYANNPLDRGHLVRRLDPAWGASEQVAKVANDDTFHFTNCSPQHEDFNQNDITWQGLENYILDNAIAENLKVSVFTGPILNEEDEFYRGVQLPRQFWKLLVMVKDGELSATAYLLSQTDLIDDLAEAFVDDRKVAHFQVSVSKIEELTGLNFSTLKSFDPMGRVESTVTTHPITSYRDILL